MSGCDTCGAAVTMVDSEGGTTEGVFNEEYECANGHRGWVRGEASAPAQEWDRYGSVFGA